MVNEIPSLHIYIAGNPASFSDSHYQGGREMVVVKKMMRLTINYGVVSQLTWRTYT